MNAPAHLSLTPQQLAECSAAVMLARDPASIRLGMVLEAIGPGLPAHDGGRTHA